MDCYMPEDRETGRSRGFAFVQMLPEDAMRAAEELDGFDMDGRILRVNEARPKGYREERESFEEPDFNSGWGEDIPESYEDTTQESEEYY